MLKYVRFTWILSLLCLTISNARANDCGAFLQNLTAPVCTDARYMLLVGSGLTYVAYQSEQTENREWRLNLNKAKPLGAFSKVGDVLGWGWPTYFYVGYQLFKGWTYKNDHALENAQIGMEAFAYTAIITGLLKAFIIADRPGSLDDRDSFPSGHSSTSFAWASVVAARHKWYYGLSAYAVSTYIAFTRIHDNKHHFHDVLGGLTLGLSYGWGIVFNHEEFQRPYWITMLPTEDLQGIGMHVAIPY